MMETLIAESHHRNHYPNRGKPQNFRDFKGINCRTFYSSGGVLPSLPPKPNKSYNNSKSKCGNCYYSEPPKARRSKSVPVLPSPRAISFSDDCVYLERWAGPAYSNSPPPSELPMPKFSLRVKRSVSLELNVRKNDVFVEPVSKSAPASPTGELSLASGDLRFFNAVATEDLKRILNLDVADD